MVNYTWDCKTVDARPVEENPTSVTKTIEG